MAKIAIFLVMLALVVTLINAQDAEGIPSLIYDDYPNYVT